MSPAEMKLAHRIAKLIRRSSLSDAEKASAAVAIAWACMCKKYGEAA